MSQTLVDIKAGQVSSLYGFVSHTDIHCAHKASFWCCMNYKDLDLVSMLYLSMEY